MEPKNVLAIDDDPFECAKLEAMLAFKGYNVLSETDPRRALSLLREGDFDTVLLDLVMPGISGFEVLSEIKTELDVPVIVVTGQGSVETAVEAMRGGAADFITKPVNEDLLDVRIKRAYEHKRTRRLANTDGLTGLINHRHFQDRLLSEVDRANRYGRDLSLLMIDLDRFKAFNDLYGHPTGDRALISVGRVLMHSSRASDLVARYGGEEFAVVLTETGEQESLVVAERMRSCVAELRLEGLENDPRAHLTLSTGLCSLRQGTSRDELVQMADSALYEAKRGGRDRVCVARSESVELPKPLSTEQYSIQS